MHYFKKILHFAIPTFCSFVIPAFAHYAFRVISLKNDSILCRKSTTQNHACALYVGLYERVVKSLVTLHCLKSKSAKPTMVHSW